MKIGVPREIKPDENRVGMIPSGVLELVQLGHQVIVEKGAGEGSNFADEEYIAAGATIVSDAESVYGAADMIVKVKEPIQPEYSLIREGQVIFTYFHFASSRPLTEAMIQSKAICIAYETVEDNNGVLPLLVPMSEVAGRMAVQEGAKYLERPMGGRGILLGGVPGVKPAKVLIIGGGVVGTQAAKMAAGLGADVTVMDIDLHRLRYLADILPKNVRLIMSNRYNIADEIKDSDLIVGAVLIPGAKAPHLITRPMLKSMRKGTVLVDVAVDQGGCIETCMPTTHANPIYEVDGIVHYCVANMPGAVPVTSTVALTNATMPYVVKLAEMGWKVACRQDPSLKKGLNIVDGKVVYKAVAEAFDLPYVEVNEVLVL